MFPFGLCATAHVEHLQMTNRIMLLKLNFFQLMKRHPSWEKRFDIYRIDAHDLKRMEMSMRESDKKMLSA